MYSYGNSDKGRVEMMKIRKLLCGILGLLMLMSSGMSIPAFALGEGSYIVSNTTYYINPDTGTADDGGDVSTGEGMCRNTVYPESLYTLKDGKHYMTLRLKLISYIKNIEFKVQTAKGNSSSYKKVSYKVVGENKEKNTKDFLIELPAGDSLLNPSFYVGPMHRDVTFFMKLDINTAKKDNGAFAAFNGTAKAASTAGAQKTSNNTSKETGSGTSKAAGSTGSGTSGNTNPEKTDSSDPKEPVKPTPEAENAGDPNTSADDNDGNTTEKETSASPKEKETKDSSGSPVWPVVGGLGVAGAGGYFVYAKKKRV